MEKVKTILLNKGIYSDNDAEAEKLFSTGSPHLVISASVVFFASSKDTSSIPSWFLNVNERGGKRTFLKDSAQGIFHDGGAPR